MEGRGSGKVRKSEGAHLKDGEDRERSRRERRGSGEKARIGKLVSRETGAKAVDRPLPAGLISENLR